MPTIATLCHIATDGRLLLQMKSLGRFGEGKWKGLGGKPKADGTPEECARREVCEESGLTVKELKERGLLHFYFGDREEIDWVVHVFSISDFEGDPKPSEEGALRWFPFDRIPFEDMWEDDRHWLPLLLRGETFHGDFFFDEGGRRLVDFMVRRTGEKGS